MKYMIPVLSQAKDWWPMCAKCNKVVDSLEIIQLPAMANKYDKAIRDYVVRCHGATEKHMLGIWAAHEILHKRGRLPNSFTKD